MSPKNEVSTGVLWETDEEVPRKHMVLVQNPHKYKLYWRNVAIFLYLHLAMPYAIYLTLTSCKLLTTVQAFILVFAGNLGVTCGAHRLWSHKSYKATTPFKVLIIIMETLAFQNSVIVWARDHRIHHKFSETDADPYNASRGFFFSHIGWLLIKRHPDFLRKQDTVDISDLTSDPLLRFQHKYYPYLMIFTAFFLPTVIPMYLWNESFINAWHSNLLRYCIGLHCIWLINSAAHMYGNRPYDKFINPAENFPVAVVGMGEGWHNFHHTFPWDYKNSELGKYSSNFAAAFIDLFAQIGWTYDLKVVSAEMVKKRSLRTGDGTHHVWGWKDKDMPKEDIEDTTILNKKL